MPDERERGTGSSRQHVGVGESVGPDERTRRLLQQHQAVNPLDPLKSLSKGKNVRELVKEEKK